MVSKEGTGPRTQLVLQRCTVKLVQQPGFKLASGGAPLKLRVRLIQ